MLILRKMCIIMIALLTCGNILSAQTESPDVTGIVKNQSGESLIGVTVKVLRNDSLITSTTTNLEGSFTIKSLKLGGPYSFIFNYIGYDSQTLTGYQLVPNKKISLFVSMKENSKELSQVVVVGYGKSSRKNVTSSISSVNNENFNSGVISSPSQLLQGKVAGLNITRSGNPNDDGAIILRGPSTLRSGGQQPFYVIDGIPGAAIDLIAPADIETIDILKDASASAIYGTRAANGVILVTTKKAANNQPKVSYNGYTSVENVSNSLQAASADELRAYALKNGQTIKPSDDEGANTIWFDEVSRQGISQNHNLSFGGGNSQTNYYGSINYLENEGIIKGTSLKRTIGRINIEQKALNDRLKLNFGISNSLSDQENIDYLVFNNILRFLPTLNVYNPDGTFREDLTRTQTYNPLALIENNQNDTRNKIILANARAQVKLPYNFDLDFSFAVQNGTSTRSQYRNKYSLLAQGANGEAIRSSYENSKKIFEGVINYEINIGNKNSLKALAGYSWQDETNGNGFQTSARNFVSDDLGYNNLGLSANPAGFLPLYGSTAIKPLRLISFFGRVNYAFDNKYLFEAALRRDGSSAFGKDKQWGYFPAVSAGWRIIQENFMAKQKLFTDLKLRVGYGVTGNSIGFDPLIAVLRYGKTGSFYYNGAYVSAIGPTQNENPDLGWEKTAMLNIGLDFSLLKNRLSGTFEVYDKRTSDLIYSYDVSATQYFVNKFTANVGGMSNKGWELSLTGIPLKTNSFEWSSNINLAHNSNMVTSLSNDVFKRSEIYTASPGGLGQTGVSTQIIKEGYPIGQFYTLRYAGRNDKNISTYYDKNGNITAVPNSLADSYYLGSAQPDLLFGWGNSLKYKAFDFNFFFRGVTGNKIMNATLASVNMPFDATNHNVPAFTLSEPFGDTNANRYSDRYLEDGSYIRLDNTTLGYTLRPKISTLKSVRFYVTGNNLFVITKYTGIDPEVNIGGNEPGLDNRDFYPKTRTFLAGLQVNF